MEPLHSGIDSLGRALQLASDFRGCHSGIEHFLELVLLRCSPASSRGSRSGHFPFAFSSASRAAWIVSKDVSNVR